MNQSSATFDVDALLTALRLADRLEGLPRMGYVISRVPSPESVAAHAYGVCFASMLLCDAIGRREDPPPVDRATVLEMAVVHDLVEVLITDIPAPVKRRIGKAHVHKAEREAAVELLAPLGGRYVELFDAYAANETLEAKIVHAADRVQMMVKVLCYERSGVGNLERFWEHASNLKDHGIHEVRRVFDRIVEHHEAGSWPAEDL